MPSDWLPYLTVFSPFTYPNNLCQGQINSFGFFLSDPQKHLSKAMEIFVWVKEESGMLNRMYVGDLQVFWKYELFFQSFYVLVVLLEH